jgi:hypothetical protein
MLDIFLPWLALRNLKRTLARRDREIDNLAREYFKRVATIKQLEERLSKAHFRNPETGRIGKKGVSYE